MRRASWLVTAVGVVAALGLGLVSCGGPADPGGGPPPGGGGFTIDVAEDVAFAALLRDGGAWIRLGAGATPLAAQQATELFALATICVDAETVAWDLVYVDVAAGFAAADGAIELSCEAGDDGNGPPGEDPDAVALQGDVLGVAVGEAGTVSAGAGLTDFFFNAGAGFARVRPAQFEDLRYGDDVPFRFERGSSVDLLAVKGPIGDGAGEAPPTDGLILRDILMEPPAGGDTVEADLDFTAQGFPLALHTVTVRGLAPGETASVDVVLELGEAFGPTAFLGSGEAPGAAVPYSGFPADRLVPGDLHVVFVDGFRDLATLQAGSCSWFHLRALRAPADLVVDAEDCFAVEPTLAATSPYPRPALAVQDVPAASFVQLSFEQGLAPEPAPALAADVLLIDVAIIGAWLDRAFTLPDFSGLAGFDAAWAPRQAPLAYVVSSFTGDVSLDDPFGVGDGDQFTTVSVEGTLTP